MVVTEEVFSFVKTSNKTWMSGEGSFVAEESENYFNVTFCYYEAYDISNDVYKCGGIMNHTGEIISPAYPFYYGENINCTWTVGLGKGTFVSLDLVDIDLALKEEHYEASAYFDCEDTLTIYDRYRSGDHVIASVKGHSFETLEEPRYLSSSYEVEINLIACPRIKETNARGFTIKVDATDCGSCGQGESSCSRQALCSHQCGYISSAAFPNFYPVSASCNWRIQGQLGQYVTVTFDMIDVIAVGECEGDYVSLYDLDLAKKKTLIGKFCKSKRPIGEIQSSWQMMDVEFYSDFDTAGRGFLLKYAGDSDGAPQPDGFEREACTMMVISNIRSTANWHDVACAFNKISHF
ncbi:tolloid-like protein 2 [Haliotis rufescens]|uniref:tolloid-like protein 2 n=1 Tax=Haliotis rufescens TaxID=6454 RepID=UPI00201F2B4E|nr:tolloid-like protein 2 [Haliotis rufescens]